MGLLSNISSMFRGLQEFFILLREFFGCLPLVVQVLIYFTFGSFMLLSLLKMFRQEV